MRFDFDDEQREIKDTARSFLASRFKPEKVRELAEAGGYDDALWSEVCELGWPGIAIDEENGGQGLGMVELTILCEEIGYACAPLPFFSNAAAGLAIEHAGSDEQKSTYLPGIASGEKRGAIGDAHVVIDGPGAEVVVLFGDEGATVVKATEAGLDPLDLIDATHRYSRPGAPGGASLPGDLAAASGRIAVAAAADLVGVAQKAMEMAVEYAKERQAVRPPDRRLPGRLPPMRADALRRRGGALADLLRRLGGRRRARVAAARRGDGEGPCLRRRLGRLQVVDPGARRDRLHLGARPALPAQARPRGGPAVRHLRAAPRAGRRACRPGLSRPPTVRYWSRSILGSGLFLACVVLFNVKLIALLNVGTCASGNQPFEISRPCPEGTELDALLLVAAVFGLFVSGGVFLTRGDRPGRRPSRFAWSLLAWGIFFGGTGAVVLFHSLTSDVVGPDAELGGIIVGATFLVMGVPALVFLATGIGSGNRTTETREFAPAAEPVSAPEPRHVPSTPAAPAQEQGAERFTDDTISKLERLQRLREAGALTPAEFEREKARVLGGG